MSTNQSIPEFHDLSLLNESMASGMVLISTGQDPKVLAANDMFFDMIGYTRDEFYDKFSDDIDKYIGEGNFEVRKTIEMNRISSTTKPFSVVIKLMSKKGDELWFFANCRVFIYNERCCAALSMFDFTEYKESIALIKAENSFAEIAENFIENSYFDFDITTSTMHYSKTFSDRFGIDSIIPNYPEAIIERGLVADDCLHLYKNRFISKTEGRHEEELHLYLPTGEDVWYLSRYDVVCDSQGKPVRAIGKLVDITGQFIKIKELSEQAQLDQLTGLYNKATTESLISETLSKRRLCDSHFALIIVDVDNFKGINDTFGHLSGDMVLAQLAGELKSIFRKNDIVGRIGGDEFFILMKNYGERSIITAKSKEILERFNRKYTRDSSTVQLSASIGIAIYDEYSPSFEALYRNADIALYQAKNRGKNTICYFEGKSASPLASTEHLKFT